MWCSFLCMVDLVYVAVCFVGLPRCPFVQNASICTPESDVLCVPQAALGQADKLDPREAAKEAAREWINNTVDALNEKVRSFYSIWARFRDLPAYGSVG